MAAPRTLGINGLGRIGKLTLWYHLAHDDFDTFVVNVGRPVGTSLQSVLEYLGKDSTYGPLHVAWAAATASATCRWSTRQKGLCQGPRQGHHRPAAERATPRTSPGGNTESPWWSTAPASSAIRTPTPTTAKGRSGATWPPEPGRS